MPETRLRRATGWLLAPATEEVPRAHAVGAMLLRVLIGLLWLYNVAWKRPPDFGQSAHNGLFKFTSYAVSHPVFAPYSWVVEHLVLPVFTPFGWLVLAAETTLAVLLLTGAWVRLAAVLGLAQSVAIALSVAYAPHEWPWSYWMLIGAHGVLLVSSAGRVFALDAVRAGRSDTRFLATSWGGFSALLGLVSVVTSLGDPLAARGSGVVSTDLSVSFGQYNLLGGFVLVVAGLLLVAHGRGVPAPSSRPAYAAAGLTLLAGFSLIVQIGFSDPILGGTATSAAWFLCIALVAAISARSPRGATRARTTARRRAHI